MRRHETRLETPYNTTWHDAPNGWSVMVVHKPGNRCVCFMRKDSEEPITLPYSVTPDLFDPICEALEAAFFAGRLHQQKMDATARSPF